MYTGNICAATAFASFITIIAVDLRIKTASVTHSVEPHFVALLRVFAALCAVDVLRGLCLELAPNAGALMSVVDGAHILFSGLSGLSWLLFTAVALNVGTILTRALAVLGAVLLACHYAVFTDMISGVAVMYLRCAYFVVPLLLCAIPYHSEYINSAVRSDEVELPESVENRRSWAESGALMLDSPEQNGDEIKYASVVERPVPLIASCSAAMLASCAAQSLMSVSAVMSVGLAFSVVCIFIFRYISAEHAALNARNAAQSLEQMSIIAALSGNFSAIYYVDSTTGAYDKLTKDVVGMMVRTECRDRNFFRELEKHGRLNIAPDDLESYLLGFDREHIVLELEKRPSLSMVFRTRIFREYRYCEYRAVMSCGGDKYITVGVYDIDEEYRRKLKQQEELRATLEEKNALEHEAHMLDAAAYRDIMTGLFNRRAYEDYLRDCGGMPDGDDFVCISLDLNDLKAVNDDLGHEAGDELIKGAAFCMKKCFGAYGQIYRHGGDEFSAMLHISSEKLKESIERFDAEMKVWRGDLAKTLSVSYGFAEISESPDSTIKELESIADQRMYDNKAKYYSVNGIDRRGQQDAYDALRLSYTKVLRVDLLNDSFNVIKIDERELEAKEGFSEKISEWLYSFAKVGNIHESDKEEYLKRTNIEYLRRYFKNPYAVYMLRYKRKFENGFQESMMEIIPAKNYSDDNQIVFLYVKRIDGDRLYLKLQEITDDADLTVQMLWERSALEFSSKLVRADEDGIYITPYMRDGRALKLDVLVSDNVRCSLYAAAGSIGGRVVWHDVELKTAESEDGSILYYVSTRMFNQYSRPGERRVCERSQSGIPAYITDGSSCGTDVMLHDISSNGISFCRAEHSYGADIPPLCVNDDVNLSFSDVINGETFHIRTGIKIVRRYVENGVTYYGCRVLDPTDDYQLYVFLYKLS